MGAELTYSDVSPHCAAFQSFTLPTRIPSPISVSPHHPERRYVSTPVLPSQKEVSSRPSFEGYFHGAKEPGAFATIYTCL